MTHQNDIDEIDIDAWLNDARAALSPRDADQARVLAALEQRLALAPQPAASAAARVNSMPTPTVELGAGHAAGLARWAVRALLSLAGVGAVALVATQLRMNAAVPTLRHIEPVAAAVTEATPVLVTPELAAESDARELVPADQAESHEEKSAPQKKKKPQRKKCRTANGLERPCVIKSSETALAANEAPPPPAAASLSKELEALRQAQRALRSGQAAQALGVLEAFEREADAPGEMQEERAAAATMARCALAPAEQDKQGLYGEFVQRYPKSAYAVRLRRTCLQQP